MQSSMNHEEISQPRLVLFASREEFDRLCREAQAACQDVFTLGASWRLGIPYATVTPSQRCLMKVTFMHVLAA